MQESQNFPNEFFSHKLISTISLISIPGERLVETQNKAKTGGAHNKCLWLFQSKVSVTEKEPVSKKPHGKNVKFLKVFQGHLSIL